MTLYLNGNFTDSKFEVTDGNGTVKYSAKSIMSLGRRIKVNDEKGEPVLEIKENFYVVLISFEVRNPVGKPIATIKRIKGQKYEVSDTSICIDGNLKQTEFTITKKKKEVGKIDYTSSKICTIDFNNEIEETLVLAIAFVLYCVKNTSVAL